MTSLWKIPPTLPKQAADQLRPFLRQTPLLSVPSLGPNTWLKLENHQITGSFKVRGALLRMFRLTPEERERGVVAASAGNHGLGVAYAGQRLGIRVEVHVPHGTPTIKCLGMAELGAQVITASENGYDATEAIAKAVAEEHQSVYLSPYDDPWVAAGNGATLGLEIIDQVVGPMTLVAPVGGGGLMSGLLAAVAVRSDREVRCVGVQSEACPAMERSLALGRALEECSASEPTLAEGLEGGVSVSTFQCLQDANVPVDTVSESAIANAMEWSRRELGEVIEGSAAVGLAWAREHPKERGPEQRVIVITGGNARWTA